MNKIGLKIKEALKAKNMTQMALAEAVGVSNNAVTKWIKSGKVAKDNILKISSILEMPLTDFFTESDDELMHVYQILQNPKLKQLLLAAEPLTDYKVDILINTSLALIAPDEIHPATAAGALIATPSGYGHTTEQVVAFTAIPSSKISTSKPLKAKIKID